MIAVQELEKRIAKPEQVKAVYESGKPLPAAPSGGAPNPALDGFRVTGTINNGQNVGVYFVMNGGLAYGITNPTTYDQLFATWDGIVDLGSDFGDLQVGGLLSDDSVIAKGATVQQYLICGTPSDPQKHWIPSPQQVTAMSFAQFVVVPQILIDACPTGFELDYRS